MSKLKQTFMVFALMFAFLAACSANPEKTIEEFSGTVENRDPDSLFELVVVDEDTYWTVQQANDVIGYFHDDREDYQEQLTLLHQQAQALDNDTMLSNEEGLFYFNEDGDLKVRKYEVTASSDSAAAAPDHISVTIDESDAIEIDSLDDSALGLFGPGEYEFQAEAEYAYAAVNNSDSFSLTSLSSFTKSINLGLTGEYIRVTSSIPDTNLKVNGEEVDFSMDSDSETPRFGPVSADITIQGTAPLPWGEAVSEEITVEETNGEEQSYDLTPPLLANEEDREQITELINQYNQTRMETYVNLDIEELTADISGDLREEIENDIKNAINYERTYKGKVLGSRVNYGAVSYEQGSGGRHYVSLPVEFHEEFITIHKHHFGDDEPKEEYRDRTVRLEYLEEEDKWIVHSVDSNWGSDMTGDDIVKTEF